MTPTRVTQGMQYLEALGNLQRNYARLFQSQLAIGSGKRVRTASDDPAGAARILDYSRRAGELAQFRRNIVASQDALEGAASDLESISGVFHQVRERVVQALNGTANDDDRGTIANELDQHLVSLFGYLNAKVGDRFSFAGTRSDAPPFVRGVEADGIERVRYVGDDLANLAEVAPGVSEAINIPGSRLIDVGPRGPTSFFGLTGARAGVGNDSGVGRAQLTVGHLITGFGPYPGALVDPASGVRGGASGNAQDTVLGFSHALSLSVNAGGTGGTVSLDGGPAVSFTSADVDLRVTGPGGEAVHLDLSQVTAGFNGLVQIDSYGTLSLDGGQTTVPINFGATSQQIVNPADGTVTHVDATAISRTGTENLTYGGTLDLFNAILSIRDLLRTTGTPQEVAAALDEARAHLDDLDRGHEAILRTLADAGSASGRLGGLDQRVADLEVSVASRRSQVEDVDLATVLTDLQEHEALYQSSLLVTARLSRISLSNFLG
jgi:flagellin-like hook-associated protein FlgL